MTDARRGSLDDRDPAAARRFPRWRAALVVLSVVLGAPAVAWGVPPGAPAQPAQTAHTDQSTQTAQPVQTTEDATADPGGASTDVGRATSTYAEPDEPVLGPAPTGWPAPASAPGAAFVLIDAETGQVLAEQDADEPRAVASTVKVLTALSVAARADLDEPVTVGDEVAGVPGSGVGLRPGDTWQVGDLLDAVISRSGNEAAEALAVHVGGSTEGFLAMMYADAAALGLGEVVLVSPSGLDDANQLSAMDLAVLARAALADETLRPFLGRREVVLPSVGRVETRNQLLFRYPDATGVKTGFTLEAGNSVIGSARRDGRELIAVVLDAGDDPARFEGAARLLDLGFDAFRPAVLEARLAFAVAGGEVAIAVPETHVLTPADAPVELDLPVTTRPPEGDVRVDVEVAGERLATVAGGLDTTEAPAPASGDAAIGRAMVDGAYAALRAAAAQDVLR